MPRYSQRMKEWMTQTMRQEIQNVSAKIIQDEGWNNFTTERIATELGMSRSVLYNYFTNKEAIVDAILHESLLAWNEKVERVAKQEELSARERLLQIGLLLLEHFERDKKIHQIVINRQPQPHAGFQEACASQARFVHQVFESGIRNGEFRAVSPESATMVFYGTIREMCIHHCRSERPGDLRQALEIVLKGVAC